MKKPLEKRCALKYLTALMMLSFLNTPAPAAPSIEDAEALLPAWKESYTRKEVTRLIYRFWIIAEEEMASTALEAAREAAADEAAHRALVEALNQDLTAQAREMTEENRRISRQKDRYKTLFLVTGGLALGTTALAALTLILK